MSVRFTIGRAVGLFGFVVTLGCVAILVANMMAISQLKVGGPIYRQIVLGKDMIADILPPPEYVIEAYLESTLALNDPSSVATHKERLGQLRKDYDLRHEYWKGEAFDPTITKMLVEDSDVEVTKFWSAVEEHFLPALERGDMDSARTAYAELAAAYTAHRAIIDKIVAATNDFNAEVPGLDKVPRKDWPPVVVIHVAFQIMVACGMAMAGLAALGGFVSWKTKRLPDQSTTTRKGSRWV